MRILKQLKGSSFLRSVLAIAGSTAAAQVIMVVISPVFTRLYSPEALGLWGLFVSFLGVASVFVNLRYEVAVVAVKDDVEASSLTRSSLVLAVFVAAALGLAFEGLRSSGFAGYNAFPGWVSPLAALALIATGWGTTLRYYAIRKGTFGFVGRYTVTQALSRVIVQLGLGFLGSGGLLIGEVVGRFVGLRPLWRILTPLTGSWFSLATIAKYRIYPLLQLPSSALDTLALMAPVPVFASAYGVAVGGALALAQRVVGLPVGLIGRSVADVFYNRAAQLAHTNPRALRSFLLVTVLRLGILSVPLAVILAHAAPRIVPWLFGSDWHDAGKMMAAMSPWMAAQLAVSPVSSVVFLSRHGWLKLAYDAGSFAVVCLPLGLSASNPVRALAIVSHAKVVQIALYLLFLIMIVGSMEDPKENADAACATGRHMESSRRTLGTRPDLPRG